MLDFWESEVLRGMLGSTTEARALENVHQAWHSIWCWLTIFSLPTLFEESLHCHT